MFNVSFDDSLVRLFLEGTEEKISKVEQRLGSDFRTRAPKRVKEAVQQIYPHIKAGKISAAKRGARGSGFNTTLIYKGGVQSVKDYAKARRSNQRAKDRTKVPGVSYNGKTLWQLHQPKPYSIEVAVKDGGSLTGEYFVGPNGHIFKRSSASPLPIERVNTLSIPAAITGENGAKSVLEDKLYELMSERLEHHIRQILG